MDHRSATASGTPALSTEVGYFARQMPNSSLYQMIRAQVSTPARAAPLQSKTIRRVASSHGRARGLKPSAP